MVNPNYVKYKALIIGYGSIGKKHYNILKKNNSISKILIFTSQKKIFNSTNDLNKIKKFNPDIIIISTTTDKHFKYLKFVNKIFKNKMILVEKPLFIKLEKINKINNKIFVGYNLRFHPIIKFLKTLLIKQKLFSVEIYCGSYLPKWRNRPLRFTSSFSKKLSGGILHELSHEIDYILYLFGDIKKMFFIRKKNSFINIKTEDYAHILARTKKNKIISVNLNYYSRIRKRFIIIETNKLSIYADLINGEVNFTKVDGKIEKKKFNFNINDTYKEQINSIIHKKFNNLCNYKFGLKTVKTIESLIKR